MRGSDDRDGNQDLCDLSRRSRNERDQDRSGARISEGVAP